MSNASWIYTKITAPVLADALERPRSSKLMDEAGAFPIPWVCRPAGSGKKTTLVTIYLKSHKQDGIWYRMEPSSADLAFLFHHLRLASRQYATVLGAAAALTGVVGQRASNQVSIPNQQEHLTDPLAGPRRTGPMVNFTAPMPRPLAEPDACWVGIRTHLVSLAGWNELVLAVLSGISGVYLLRSPLRSEAVRALHWLLSRNYILKFVDGAERWCQTSLPMDRGIPVGV